MTTTTSPARVSLSEGVEQVNALLAALNGIDLHALSSPVLMDAVGQVENLRRQIEALGAKVLTAAQTDGAWATTGARTFTAWYRNTTGRHHVTATAQVRLARLLRQDLPLTAQALADGQISIDHVSALTRHAVNSPTRLTQLRDPDLGEAFLLAHAKTMDASDFLNLVKHWAIRTDPDAADRSWKQDSERQELLIAPTMGGYHLQGWLTTSNAQTLLTALDARTGTPTADGRTTPQRRADSLVSLAHLCLDSGILRPGARIRPHLCVTVPFDTLQRLTTAAAPAPDEHHHPASTTPTTNPVIPTRLDHTILTGAEPATLADGEPLPHQLLARLACQGALHRIVFGPDSQILDVGREERLFTAAQTRAIIARDRRCPYPGCGAPPGEGEIHHSIWWYAQHGRTDTNHGILLCWFHHDYVHRHQITIERTHNTWQFTRTDATTITTTDPTNAIPPTWPTTT